MKAAATAASATRAVFADYWELTKARLTFFVLIVVALSAWLAGAGSADTSTGVGATGGVWIAMLVAVVGTGMVAAGAAAFNMVIERHADARMPRTWNRPLPSGRLRPYEVVWFGAVLTVAGLALLGWAATPLACGLAALTSVTYLAIYTPLKRVTPLNTYVGAVPGALPALVGWAAVHGELHPGAWALFLLVYFWQLPHFLSIAWIYREDYERGGFVMLPRIDPTGAMTGRQAVMGALTLIPISLLPALWRLAGPVYCAGAIVLGVWFAWRAIGFARERTIDSARCLMRTSLLYLPAVLFLLFLDASV